MNAGKCARFLRSFSIGRVHCANDAYQVFNRTRSKFYAVIDDPACIVLIDGAEQFIPRITEIRDGTVKRLGAFFHRAEEVFITDVRQVFGDRFGIVLNGRRNALERKRNGIAVLLCLDAELFQAFKFARRSISNRFNHLIQRLAHR